MQTLFIDATGVPTAYPTRAAAMAQMRDRCGYTFDQAQQDQAQATLDAGGIFAFFSHPAGARPHLGALAECPEGTDPHAFINAHLTGLPKSQACLAQARAAWEARAGATPRIGDVYTDATGQQSRFTLAHGDTIQAGGGVGYFLGRHGLADYSGTLSRPMPTAGLTRQPGEQWRPFWFFLDGETGNHRGVVVQIPVHIWVHV